MKTHRFVARAVVEFTTPFIVGASRGGDIADAVCVTDANGLPAIPGSSLAGALRAAFRRAAGQEAEKSIFGYQENDDGRGSRLTVSWACIHDSKDVPVEGIAAPERLADAVLAKAMCPAVRDHVRISHKGASDSAERGKFDEQAVCAGHRFSFELELAGGPEDATAWKTLLGLLSGGSLRLGGKTRRGFGAFKLVSLSLRDRAFDLRKEADFSAYRKHPVSLKEKDSLPLTKLEGEAGRGGMLTVLLELTPRGFWMFGGGHDLPESKGDADMAPVRDCRIAWEGGKGAVEEDLILIPAASIKGALSHRVAFHYNALTGRFCDKERPEDICGENNGAVKALFGFVKDQSGGRRGRVLIDDILLKKTVADQLVHHVGIDRYTGGARDQALFCERPLWGEKLGIAIHVSEPEDFKDDAVKKAFALALDDLAQGRLQLGAGSGRGEGYFEGKVVWPKDARWGGKI